MVKMQRVLAIGLGLLILPLSGCEELPTGPDTTPPTLTLLSPIAGSTATDTIVVQVNASDDRGVAKVELYFDTLSTPFARATAAPYRLLGPLADIGGGGHTFQVVATDSSGNTASIGPIAFTAVVNPGLKFISRMLVDGSARDVDASGAYAYVAAWDGGVIVVDVSNPMVPVTALRYDTPGFTHGVTVAGSILFVADGVEGVISFSLSDPANPVELARLKLSGMDAHDVAVSGNYAYAAGGAGGLYALDISNPDSLINVGVYNQGGDVRDVELSGNYAYTAEMNEGLRVIDINRPDSMFAVDQYVGSGLQIYDVSLWAGYAYVAAGDDGAQAVDVSTPSSITIADFFVKNGVMGIVAMGSLTYISAGALGVEVINSTDPANLLAIANGIFDTDGLSYRLKSHAGYILVADNAQLTILKYVP